MKIVCWQDMRRTLECTPDADGVPLVYEQNDRTRGQESTGAGRLYDREKLKEELTPYLKELIQKMWKEEREYYKSRPSLAVRHYGAMLPAMRESSTLEITARVYSEMEKRLRKEWLRKGGN